MLFSSVPFLIFLIIVYLLVLGASKLKNGRQVQIYILLVASLFFYSYWNAAFLILLVISIVVNFVLSKSIIAQKEPQSKKPLFLLGIIFNLGLIAYYKYAYFLVDSINGILGTSLNISNDIFLPLGISFFTFQQIAYLIDCKKGIENNYSFIDYSLFVSFFPQLIAGPIVHHKEMMPQFEDKKTRLLTYENLGIGLLLFSIGLFKKLIIADNMALISDPYFLKSTTEATLGFAESWNGILAYTFQIYFDFSGYCDMALGVARMFGIILPLNFFSPYKSRNIVQFWRTWHITLSRFLRDYLYIPLGGNRKGKYRRYLNLLITMLIGGLWHGASWTFVVWGGLHGLYIMINHAWTEFKSKLSFSLPARLSSMISIFITFFAVVIAWVYFKATSFESANKVVASLFDFGQRSELESKLILLQEDQFQRLLEFFGFVITDSVNQYAFIESSMILLIVALIVWVFPNSTQIVEKYKPAIDPTHIFKNFSDPFKVLDIQFKPSLVWAIGVSVIFVFSILNMNKVSPFLYFQF